MTTNIDPEKALMDIARTAPAYAKAKAERIYLEEFRKSKKAILMSAHSDKAIGAQEREAYADVAYIELLSSLRAAVEQEEALRWRLVAAQAACEVWRSMEASGRLQDRAAR